MDFHLPKTPLLKNIKRLGLCVSIFMEERKQKPLFGKDHYGHEFEILKMQLCEK